MPIDPNIALSLKPIQLANPLEQYMQAQQIQASQNQNRLADLMYTEKQRDTDQNILLNNLYKSAVGSDGSLDRSKLYTGVAGAGLGSKLPGIQKSFADADKVLADVEESKAKTGNYKAETAGKQDDLREKKRQRAITDIAAFKTPQEALASLAAHEQAGDLAPDAAAAVRATIPQNPADFPKWQIGMLQRIMSAGEGMKYLTPDANTVSNNATSRANNAATNATTRRGQDMTDARARELGQQGQYDSERGVVVDKTTGVARPVVGADGKPLQAGGKMTEDQAKATGWLVQAENAWKNMQAVGLKNGKPTDAAKPGRVEAALSAAIPFGAGEAAANSWRGADRQKFLQGASSLSEALLRAATGAGVNKDEAAQKVRELTPVWGDTDENIKQKMDSIPLYIESLKVRSGPGAAKAAAVLKAPAAAGVPDDIAALLQKHGGK
jgi:hypothetical protein